MLQEQKISSVLVIGATGQIGDFLLPALRKKGYEVHAISRRGIQQNADGVQWHHGDVSQGFQPGFSFDAIIHLAYLPLLPDFLDALPEKNVKRVIAFSSTSRFTKECSPDGRERAVAISLALAEERVQQFCLAHNATWTILRPTLIYGRGTDGNISTIMRFIRRFKIFPLIGGGKALRQPVHAEDLAQAALLAMESAAAANQAYNLSGGETLTYQEMVRRIFQKLGRRPAFIPVPLLCLRFMMAVLRLIPGYRHLSQSMVNRLVEDLCFDHSAATQDFGYRPGRFRP